MTRRRGAFFLLGVALFALGACGGDADPPASTTSVATTTTTAPSTTATIPVPQPAIDVAIDDFRFAATPIGVACVELAIVTPDGETIIEERCANSSTSIYESPWCLRYADGATQDEAPESALGQDAPSPRDRAECELEAPVVLFGRAVGDVAHVCAVEWFESAFGRPRFLPVDPQGIIFTRVQDDRAVRSPGFHFSEDGTIVGDPPLDAPSAPIYEMCAELAPWSEEGSNGPSEALALDPAEVALREADPSTAAGVDVRFEFSSGEFVTFRDNEVVETSLGFIRFPSILRIRVGEASAEVAFPALPDVDQSWSLIFELDADAVTVAPDGIRIDGAKVRAVWEEY